MRPRATRRLPILVLSAVFTNAITLAAQSNPGKPTALIRVEPGLENAVKWTWHVAQSDEKEWGFDMPTPTPSPTPSAAAMGPPESRPAFYEVKHGDALILIGRKFNVTVEQLKAYNGLKNDTIRVGQKLKIPTLAEVIAAAPTPKKLKEKKSAGSKESAEAGAEFDPLRIQIFLDREQFSTGPIGIEPSPLYPRIVLLYETTHEDAKDDPALIAKARAAVGNVFTRYKLRPEDFRFIESATPKETVEPNQAASGSHLHRAKHPVQPAVFHAAHPTYDQLTSARTLVYRTPWEFVAERFHCQESYLRILNDKLPAQPGVGAEFQVPNVIPFEIEKAFDDPLQPQPDPNNPVTASVVGLSQLYIYQNGKLVAVFPLSPARPGLHGRGSWKVLDVIPRPRLGTLQELRPELVKKPAPGTASPEPTPSPPVAELTSEQYLAAGPRNPVGILWINLAKSTSTDPLPYGLHGTSIPDQMNSEESLGGFRLSNWDIARAVHYLPSGTPLEWK
jgi:LysM repeat protein/lipoprotein-anchoring transpeptidase ErfK/SrfK